MTPGLASVSHIAPVEVSTLLRGRLGPIECKGNPGACPIKEGWGDPLSAARRRGHDQHAHAPRPAPPPH
eukprot:5635801-Prymnesium_polylepis.1